MKGLLWWIDCLRGNHMWVQLDDERGKSYTYCLHCGDVLSGTVPGGTT